MTVTPAVVAEEPVSDPDYLVQGEYQGTLISADGVHRKYGLQVVALSNDEFSAVMYQGGFPGTGFDGLNETRLTGNRVDNRIRLVSEDGSIQAWMEEPYTRFWHFAMPALGRQMGTLSGIRRQSPTLGMLPPYNATVLFNGETTNGLDNAKIDENGWLERGFITSEPVKDFRLHLEFRTPWEPDKRGQQRGNSGVYIQRRYEVQILDSFGLPQAFNHCASLYRQLPAKYNLALPPLSWQTYDIEFRAARFNEAGERTEKATITVRHNGVVVHDAVKIETKTGAGQQEGPNPLPILFQDHSNPVKYRNLWIVPL